MMIARTQINHVCLKLQYKPRISLIFVFQNCKGALRMGTLIKNWALEHDIDGQKNFVIINLDVYLTAFLSIKWMAPKFRKRKDDGLNKNFPDI